VNGPVKIPITYIGSNNTEGGRIAARGAGQSDRRQGKPFTSISTNPNVSSVEEPRKGFKEAMAKGFPNIKVLGPDYNLDDPNKATQETAAVLGRANPTLPACSAPTCSARKGRAPRSSTLALAGHVQVRRL